MVWHAHRRRGGPMLKKSAAPKNAGRRLTFVLPADSPVGRVSVVGTCNDWTPGAHVLRRRSNGTRSVSVTLPAGSTVRFRYLGEDGHLFDDPDARAVTSEGGEVHLCPCGDGARPVRCLRRRLPGM